MNTSPHYAEEHINMGNRESFTVTYRRFYAPLCYFAYRMVMDEAGAEDIVNELFTRLFQRRELFRDEEHLKAYLYRSVHHAALNHLRSANNARSREGQYMNENDDWTESAQQHFIRAEVYQEIYRAILALPPQSSKVIRMSYLEGRKNAEIAQLLGISDQTVKNHKQNGLKLLRGMLNRDTFFALLLLAGSPLCEWM